MKTLFFVSVFGVIVLCAMVSGPFATQPNTIPKEEKTNTLEDRVAALEEMVAALNRRIQDDKLVNSLQGKWIEESYVKAGEHQVVPQNEPGRIDVVWNLTSDAKMSGRWILTAEPTTDGFGRFSVDTSKTPAWIDFELHSKPNMNPHIVRGIVQYTHQRAMIALPGRLSGGDAFLNPPRPTSFDSTAENGYAVHKLIRESYKKTGVW